MSGAAILSTVYDRITSDGSAVSRLANDPLTGGPAVYDTFATAEIGPYVVTGFEIGEPDGRMIASGRVTLDLFDRRPQTQSREDLWELAELVYSLFDRYMDVLAPGSPRFFIASEEPIDEDEGRMRAWRITLNVRYGRS